MKRLAILRPEPGASASVARARAMGIDVFALPLFAIQPIAWEAPNPDNFDAILMTSANAARMGGSRLAQLTRLPVHAVGAATAAAAREAGFKVETVGTGSGADLRRQLPSGLRLLHLAGRHHRPLDQTTVIPVYESKTLPVPADLDRLDGAVAAVHSPRAGQRLAELIADRSRTAIAAISPAAADACGEGWASVDNADYSTDAALLALAARLCEAGTR